MKNLTIEQLQAEVTQLTNRVAIIESFIRVHFGTSFMVDGAPGQGQIASDNRRSEVGMGPILGGSTYE